MTNQVIKVIPIIEQISAFYLLGPSLWLNL